MTTCNHPAHRLYADTRAAFARTMTMHGALLTDAATTDDAGRIDYAARTAIADLNAGLLAIERATNKVDNHFDAGCPALAADHPDPNAYGILGDY